MSWVAAVLLETILVAHVSGRQKENVVQRSKRVLAMRQGMRTGFTESPNFFLAKRLKCYQNTIERVCWSFPRLLTLSSVVKVLWHRSIR